MFVAGLPFSTTSEELKSLFEQVGVVVSSNIIIDRETGNSRGFGFVEMPNKAEAEAAIGGVKEIRYGGIGDTVIKNAVNNTGTGRTAT